MDNWVSNILQNFGINWNPSAGTVNGLTYDAYADPGQALWWVARSLEVFEDLQQFGTYLLQNPVLAFQYLISWQLFDFPLHIEEFAFFSNVPFEAVYAAIPAVAAAPLASAGALGGLAGLAALPQPAVVAAPPALAPPLLPVVAIASSVAAPAAAPTSASAPAPTTPSGPAPAIPAPTPPAAPTGPPGFAPPYLVPPAIGAGARMSTSASSSAKRKAPKPNTAAAAAAAATREAARARRRRRAKQRDFGDEFMDMNIDVDPDWGTPAGGETSASDRGAGSLGFAGTAPRESVAEAAGLTTLAGDEFGGGPKMPMMPGTWDPDGGPEDSDEA